jgi:hypothetical protein
MSSVEDKKAAADKKKADLKANLEGKKPKRSSKKPKKKADKKSAHVSKLVYDWDCIMLFPISTNDKPNKKLTPEFYATSMAGIKKWRKSNMIDNARQIFRSDRCYLTDANVPDPVLADIAKRAAAEENQAERGKINNERIDVAKRILMKEFEDLTGSSEPCSQKVWCELIIKAVCRRVQLACGLTVAMKETIDADEVIMCIQADENDLKTEADRTDYKVQLHNKPFAYSNEEQSQQSRSHFNDAAYLTKLKRDNPKAYGEAKARLTKTCDENGEVLDPALTRKGLQKELFQYMQGAGHREEFSEHDMKNRYKHLLPKYSTYIAPYDEYKMEDEFQPFFRHFLTKTGESSVFRNVDRVRLTTSILERHLNLGFLEVGKYMLDFFPMHDSDEVEWLKRNWVFNMNILPFPGAQTQPIGAIRNYYGEKVALYFAWLEHYSRALFFPTVLGLLFVIFEDSAPQDAKTQGFGLMVYCTLVGLWATTMTEFWKGRNAFLNLCWGMTDFKAVERERAEFIGVVRLSPITDLKEMYHVSRGQLYWRMFYSMSFLSFLVLIAVTATYFLLFMKNFLVTGPPCFAMGGAIAGAANAIQIGVFNELYTMLAEYLTGWENHRTQSEYENQLVMKTFLFRFFNSYSSFFYIAFVKDSAEAKPFTVDNSTLTCQAAICNNPAGCGGCLEDDCMGELKGALASIFITQIIVGNAAEVCVPVIVYKLKTMAEKKKVVSMQKKELKKKQAVLKKEAEDAGVEYVEDVEAALLALEKPSYEQPEKETKVDTPCTCR